MSKYDFNPTRCKEAIESLSKMVYDDSYTTIRGRDQVLLGVILDDLLTDIEALHRAASERDDILDSLENMPIIETSSRGLSIALDEIEGLIAAYRDDSEYKRTAALDL